MKSIAASIFFLILLGCENPVSINSANPANSTTTANSADSADKLEKEAFADLDCFTPEYKRLDKDVVIRDTLVQDEAILYTGLLK